MKIPWLAKMGLSRGKAIGWFGALCPTAASTPLDMEQLGLKLKSTWGGARKGAGRPRTKATYVRHRVREKLAPRLPVHVTVRMLDGVESMRQPHLFKVVARAFWAAQGKFGMRLTHFSVQGKHLHLIVEGVDKVGLRRSMTGLNVRIAVGLNRAMNSAGRCVKERYHRHILKTPSEVRKAVHYVLRNHERKPKTRTQVRGGA